MTQYIIPRGTLVQPVQCTSLSDKRVTLNRNIVLNETHCLSYFEAKTIGLSLNYYAFDFIIEHYWGFWYVVADVIAERL